MAPQPIAASLRRRRFLQSMTGLATGLVAGLPARANDLPKNTNPRSIFGDSAEPAWDHHVTITVGQDKAELAGTTDRVIQAAVDYVARRGGGTVRVMPGTYRLRNSIFLQSKVRLLGSGADTVLLQGAINDRQAHRGWRSLGSGDHARRSHGISGR